MPLLFQFLLLFVCCVVFNGTITATVPDIANQTPRFVQTDNKILFSIIEPSDYMVVTHNELVVKGYQRYRGLVAINGRKTRPRVDGRFHQAIHLSLGPNIIYVATRLPNQPSASVLVRRIYRIPNMSTPQFITELAGVSMGPSRSSRPITRIDVASVLAVIDPSDPSHMGVRVWSDVSSMDLKMVNYVVAKGWMGGLDDRFEPHSPISQLELLVMAKRINPKLSVPQGSKSTWPFAYEKLALKMGFSSATTSFQPNGSVSLPMLHRWIHALSPKLSAIQIPPDTVFLDRAKLAATLAVLVSDDAPSTVSSTPVRPATPPTPILVSSGTSTQSIEIRLDGHWLKETVVKLAASGALSGWIVGDTSLMIDRSFLKSYVLRGELLTLLGSVSRSPIDQMATTIYRSSDLNPNTMNRRLTKVEALIALTRWAGVPCSPTQNRLIQGLPTQHWGAAAVTCAIDAGWISNQTIIYPRTLITRAELLSILVKFPVMHQRIRP